MSIQVLVRNVYGNAMIYPVCEKAHIFAKMGGHKTLTSAAIRDIKALGYEVQVVQPPVVL